MVTHSSMINASPHGNLAAKEVLGMTAAFCLMFLHLIVLFIYLLIYYYFNLFSGMHMACSVMSQGVLAGIINRLV